MFRPLLSNIPNTFPTNSSRNKIKFNVHTCCLEKDGIIRRRVHEPLVFNFLKASFSCLFHQWICVSSSRMLVAVDDDCGIASGALTCMSALTLEEELLVEQADPE